MASKKSLYQVGQTDTFKASRNTIEKFIRCPRCTVLEQRHGIKQPSSPPFTLNSAVDELFKHEFDIYRKAGEVHPLVEQYGLQLVPFAHEDMNEWRNNFKGIQFVHAETNLLLTGAVDDIWVDENGVLTVVDYKATSRAGEIIELGEGGFYESYRRQLSFYVWLLRQNGFKVSDTGYWVYANGIKTKARFDNTLTFKTTMISYETETSWIEPTLRDFKIALEAPGLPEAGEECDHCKYVAQRENLKI